MQSGIMLPCQTSVALVPNTSMREPYIHIMPYPYVSLEETLQEPTVSHQIPLHTIKCPCSQRHAIVPFDLLLYTTRYPVLLWSILYRFVSSMCQCTSHALHILSATGVAPPTPKHTPTCYNKHPCIFVLLYRLLRVIVCSYTSLDVMAKS